MTKVIGSQTDVPDIGDPIVSPWYQDTAKKIVHVFATTTARDAWVAPPDGATCQAPAGTTWNRVGGVWIRPPGILVASQVIAYPNLNTTTAGIYDLATTGTPTFPYPVKVIVLSIVGMTISGAADGSFGIDTVPLTAAPTSSTGTMLAKPTYWSYVSQSSTFNVAANVDTRVKGRINIAGTGAGTAVTGGSLTVQIFTS